MNRRGGRANNNSYICENRTAANRAENINGCGKGNTNNRSVHQNNNRLAPEYPDRACCYNENARPHQGSCQPQQEYQCKRKKPARKHHCNPQGSNDSLSSSSSDSLNQIPEYLQNLAMSYGKELDSGNCSNSNSTMNNFLSKIGYRSGESDYLDNFIRNGPFQPLPADSGCYRPELSTSQTLTESRDDLSYQNSWVGTEINPCQKLKKPIVEHEDVQCPGYPNKPMVCPEPGICNCQKLRREYEGGARIRCGDPKLSKCYEDPDAGKHGMPGCQRCQFLHCKCGLCRQCRIYDYVLTISNFKPQPGEETNRKSKKCSSKKRSNKDLKDCCPYPDTESKYGNKKKPKHIRPGQMEVVGGPLMSEYQAKYCFRPMPKKSKKLSGNVGETMNLKNSDGGVDDDYKSTRPPWNDDTKITPTNYELSLEAAEAKLKELDRILEDPEGAKTKPKFETMAIKEKPTNSDTSMDSDDDNNHIIGNTKVGGAGRPLKKTNANQGSKNFRQEVKTDAVKSEPNTKLRQASKNFKQEAQKSDAVKGSQQKPKKEKQETKNVNQVVQKSDAKAKGSEKKQKNAKQENANQVVPKSDAKGKDSEQKPKKEKQETKNVKVQKTGAGASIPQPKVNEGSKNFKQDVDAQPKAQGKTSSKSPAPKGKKNSSQSPKKASKDKNELSKTVGVKSEKGSKKSKDSTGGSKKK